VDTNHPAFVDAEREVGERIGRLVGLNGERTVDSLHQELGRIIWNFCGMARNEAGLAKALSEIVQLRERFWREARVPGVNEEFNVSLERALRVADHMEFAEVVCQDALARRESCGAHFREEHQTSDGEAERDDQRFCHVAAWEFKGVGMPASLHVEPLNFEEVHLAARSYR
jgi:succinate dehydrogenase / fumarate reductase flavoprotein subunit